MFTNWRQQISFQRLPTYLIFKLMRLEGHGVRAVAIPLCPLSYPSCSWLGKHSHNQISSLCGVVVYFGANVRSGRYVAYVRSSDAWFQMDGERVQSVDMKVEMAKDAIKENVCRALEKM